MSEDCKDNILKPVIERVKSYMERDMGIKLLKNQDFEINYPMHIKLNKNTAIISTIGRVNIILAIGYDDELLDRLTNSYLEGEKVSAKEYVELREGAACEVANTIVGNVIEDPLDRSPVQISPPIFINGGKSLSQYKGIKSPNKIAMVDIATEFGRIVISAMGPKEYFMDALLNEGDITC